MSPDLRARSHGALEACFRNLIRFLFENRGSRAWMFYPILSKRIAAQGFATAVDVQKCTAKEADGPQDIQILACARILFELGEGLVF